MSKKKKLSIVGLVVALSLVVSSSAAYACWPWINLVNYTIEKGKKVTLNMGLGWGVQKGNLLI